MSYISANTIFDCSSIVWCLMVFLETITGMKFNGNDFTIPYTERHTREQNATVLSTIGIKNRFIFTLVMYEG